MPYPLLVQDRELHERPWDRQGMCGNKEDSEYKCEEAVVTSAVVWYNLECITEDATWRVAFDNLTVISVGDSLSLLITQIHCNFI